MCHSEKRKEFFTLGAVKGRNELSEDVVQAPSLTLLKIYQIYSGQQWNFCTTVGCDCTDCVLGKSWNSK